MNENTPSTITHLDYFAGLAMQGFLARYPDYSPTLDNLAEISYDMAVALLKERDKRNAVVGMPTECSTSPKDCETLD